MIFIFGFGHQKKDTIGPVHEQSCPRCEHAKLWILEKYSEWFTLFFIPIFPTFRSYYQYCPVCREKQMLTKEQFERLKPLAELNNSALNSNMDKEEYQKKYNQI